MPKLQAKSVILRTYTKENLKQAVQRILNENVSIRSVALKFNIPRMTLQRYLRKAKITKDLDKINFGPRNEHLRVFQDGDEILLRDFFLYASKVSYGLSIKEGRRFVYEYAVAKQLPTGPKWKEEKMAPYDWFYCFMKRHQLSLQPPDQAGQMCLSSEADNFFENLREVLERYQLKAQDVYRRNNLNKTFKVIAQKAQ